MGYSFTSFYSKIGSDESAPAAAAASREHSCLMISVNPGKEFRSLGGTGYTSLMMTFMANITRTYMLTGGHVIQVLFMRVCTQGCQLAHIHTNSTQHRISNKRTPTQPSQSPKLQIRLSCPSTGFSQNAPKPRAGFDTQFIYC